MLKKLKSLLLDDTLYITLLLMLVGLGSFGLGKMSASTVKMSPTTAALNLSPVVPAAEIKPLVTASTSTESAVSSSLAVIGPVSTHNFVASKSGTKYHKLSCGGAKQIKDTNKIFFTTEDEARSAGYTRAANCTF